MRAEKGGVGPCAERSFQAPHKLSGIASDMLALMYCLYSDPCCPGRGRALFALRRLAKRAKRISRRWLLDSFDKVVCAPAGTLSLKIHLLLLLQRSAPCPTSRSLAKAARNASCRPSTNGHGTGRSQATSRRAETTWYSQTYSSAPSTLGTQCSRDFVQLVAHFILFGARDCSSATKLLTMLHHERTTT